MLSNQSEVGIDVNSGGHHQLVSFFISASLLNVFFLKELFLILVIIFLFLSQTLFHDNVVLIVDTTVRLA